MSIADWIRAEQDARGWTNQELGERVGVGWRTISRWRNNGKPPKKQLAALERVFSKSPPSLEARLAQVEAELAELRKRLWGLCT